MSGSTYTVSTQTELNAAIVQIDLQSTPGTDTITFAGTITEGDAGQPAGIYALDTAAGVNVVIDGAGNALNGAGADGGLAVIGGKVTIKNLIIEDTLAQGGTAYENSGGGAGLGGGVFVGPSAQVTLSNVSFKTDTAQGGAGGSGGTVGFGLNGREGGNSSLIVAPLGGTGAHGSTGVSGADGGPPSVGEGTGAPGGPGGPGGLGGVGAKGGSGGNGGAGGRGAAGTSSSGTAGARGGRGGTGGLGGTGGTGGTGGRGGRGGSGGRGGTGGGGGGGNSATYRNTPYGLVLTYAPAGVQGGSGGHGGDAGPGRAGGAGGFGAGGGGGGAGGEGGGGGPAGKGGSGEYQDIFNGNYTTQQQVRGAGLAGGNGNLGGIGGAGAAGGAGGFGGGGGGGGGGGIGGNGGNGGTGGSGGYTIQSAVTPAFRNLFYVTHSNALAAGSGGKGGSGAAGGGGGDGGIGGFGGGGGGGGAGGVGGPGGLGGRGGLPGTTGGYPLVAGADGPNGATGHPGLGGFAGKGGAAGFGGGAGGTGSNPTPTSQGYHVHGGGAGGGGLGAGGDIFVAQGGSLLIDGGLLAAGTVAGGTGAHSGQGLGSGIFLQGNETITLAATSALPVTVSGVIADQTGSGGEGANAGTGALNVAGTGTVQLATKNTFKGGIEIASGTLDLAHTGAAGGGAIAFAAASDATLELAAGAVPSNSIDHFAAGDTIEVTGLVATGHGYAANELTLSAGTQSIMLDLPGGFTTGSFRVTPDLSSSDTSVTLACFRRGTRILTARGEIAVEDLAVGGMAATLAGALRPIVWMGHRHVDCRRHKQPADAWPVCIHAGAFGDNLPHRDLWLSPDHAVFVAGALIPIRHLINDATVMQEPHDNVIYWHVELERHDVLLAEGLPCESYLDTGNRHAFSNGPVTALHPQFGITAASAWSGQACAPLIESGARITAARARLAERAMRLGRSLSGVLDIMLDAAGCVSVMVRADVHTIRLVSASCRVGSDRRLLGALMTGIRADGAAIPLTDGRLVRGFHETEWHGATPVRWTGGAGVVRLGAAPHPRLIEIEVGAVSSEIAAGQAGVGSG